MISHTTALSTQNPQIIYDPVVELRLVVDGSKPRYRPPALRRVAGLFASFAVSGLMHELLAW